MNIKSLGLEELSLSEKKEVNGGNPVAVIGWIVVAGIVLFCLKGDSSYHG